MYVNATLAPVLDPQNKDEKKPIKLRIIFDRTPRYYSTRNKTRLTKAEFANPNLKITKTALTEIEPDKLIAQEIIDELGAEFSFPRFKEEYKSRRLGKRVDKTRFSSTATEYFEKRNISVKTKIAYNTAMNWINAYRQNVKLTDIDSDFVLQFIQYMKQEHKKKTGRTLSENTIRIHLRSLRTIYSYAIDKGYVNGNNPFSKIPNQPLSSQRRQNAGLDPESLSLLLAYKPKDAVEIFGKDFFLLSFNLCGMNIGDILRIKNNNITGNQLEIIRRKTKRTGRTIQMELTPYAVKILNKYGHIRASKPDEYVLPFLALCGKDSAIEEEKAIENKIHDIIKKINKGLARISKNLEMKKITTYTARHTYATLFRDQSGLSPEQLQKFLGHADLKTTQGYLGSLSRNIQEQNKNFIEDIMEGNE